MLWQKHSMKSLHPSWQLRVFLVLEGLFRYVKYSRRIGCNLLIFLMVCSDVLNIPGESATPFWFFFSIMKNYINFGIPLAKILGERSIAVNCRHREIVLFRELFSCVKYKPAWGLWLTQGFYIAGNSRGEASERAFPGQPGFYPVV